jgi:hypothetical protein
MAPLFTGSKFGFGGGPSGILLPNIGDAFEGGFFAGFISHTADGNPTHALIVAPSATGATGSGYTLTTRLAWKTTNTTTAGTTSLFDGAANTAAMVTAGIANHPAAQFCVNLNIGGYNDWYLPARSELEIAYYNLKPTTNANVTFSGINDYSVPKRTANYTTGDPAQTSIASFQSTGSESFQLGEHWSSTEVNANDGWRIIFETGAGAPRVKFFSAGGVDVRAFRRIAL